MHHSRIRLADLDQANILEVDVADEVLRQNALSLMADWVTRKPLYCVRRGLAAVICARAKDVSEVLMDDGQRFSVVAPKIEGYEIFDLFGGVESVLQMDGARHSRIRGLMQPAFTPRAVNALLGAIQQIVTDKIDAIERGSGFFDAMGDFCDDIITRVMLDATLQLTPPQQQAFTRVHNSFPLIMGIAPGEAYPEEYVEAGRALHQAVLEIIEEKRRHPREDFISNLVTARDGNDDKLSDEELVNQIYAVCAAAQGATAASLGAALLNLGRHPDQFDSLKRDPALVDSALEECLRYQSSGFLIFPRFATTDTEVGGVAIPKHMPVYVSAQAANFDPEKFPDPLRFDIRRNPQRIFTFGSGAHSCIGMRMARLVMRISLLSLMQRFPRLGLVDLDFEPVYGGNFSELSPLTIPMRTH
ncbi:MAG: hypothetical protein JWM78_3663 [Verrucomicrobiaceae bacterium]|nr:hypothetical protein [Verrucomicrobiaceae bacterium]